MKNKMEKYQFKVTQYEARGVMENPTGRYETPGGIPMGSWEYWGRLSVRMKDIARQFGTPIEVDDVKLN